MSLKFPSFKLPSFNPRLNSRIIIGIAVLALIVGAAFAFSTPPPPAIPAGWEVKAGMDHFEVNDYRVDIASTTNLYSGYAGAAVSSFKIDDGVECSTWDDALKYTGSTRVSYGISGPTHVSWNQGLKTWVPDLTDEVPFQQYTKTVGNATYMYDHHVYEVDIMTETEGEKAIFSERFHGTCDGLPSASGQWLLPDGTAFAYTKDMDHTAEFRVFVLFSLTPWEIAVGHTMPHNSTHYYQVTDVFYGVMGASMIDINLGKVGDASPTFGGVAASDIEAGFRLNLYSADESSLGLGWYNPKDDGDEPVLGSIKGIPTALMFEVAGRLEPGLVVTPGAIWGTWDAATPVQNFVDFRVRIDILTAFGVVLISGAQPTGTTIPTRYQPPPNITPWWQPFTDLLEDFNLGLQDLLGAMYGPLIMIAIIAVVALVFYLLLKLGILKRGVSGGGLA